MGRKCLCCQSEMTGGKCARCGFVPIVAVDTSGELLSRKKLETYRATLLSKIRDISILTYNYQRNNSTGILEKRGENRFKIADGVDCFNKIYWADWKFSQHPEEQWKKQALHVSYTYEGKEIEYTTEIMPVQTDDFWKVGVKLYEDFSLQIFIGNEKQNSSSDIYAVNFS